MPPCYSGNPFLTTWQFSHQPLHTWQVLLGTETIKAMGEHCQAFKRPMRFVTAYGTPSARFLG